MLGVRQLTALLADAGVTVIDVTERVLERPLGPWLAQAGTGGPAADEIRERLRAEPAGAPPTGFAPRVNGRGELLFTQTFAACLARS